MTLKKNFVMSRKFYRLKILKNDLINFLNCRVILFIFERMKGSSLQFSNL